ncbi:MAG: thioredoxin-dependent thiol peroxidase [Gemmatimonadota bacterium]|nr:MAG: thioredoxin-dependent thiol peroxidase [Gemmatimonadota bacterium]
MTVVTEGSKAPPFTLLTDAGDSVSLSDFLGTRVVLYFYPKDDTPGCTVQACDFRDRTAVFKSSGTVVLGVSPDSVASHAEFKEKFDLDFPLLVDQDHAVCEAYGVWREKSMYGRNYWGVERSTFLIDDMGMVIRVWRKVKPKGHAEEIEQLLSG